MLILNPEQARAADRLAAQEEGITSLDLMERASRRLAGRLLEIFPLSENKKYIAICGGGNNGGDGMAIARILYNAGAAVECFALKCFHHYSPDCLASASRLSHSGILSSINSQDDFPPITPGDIVIDAIFGSGLSRKADGLAALIISHINQSGAHVVSVDVPSGLSAGSIPLAGDAVIRAEHTLTVQSPFVSLLMPECEPFAGKLSIVDIGIEKYQEQSASQYHYFAMRDAARILEPRKKFSHKGTFGHALVAAGSLGKGGAAVLCARACHRAGAGLVTARIPARLAAIMQIASPETMVYPDSAEDCLSQVPDTSRYSAVAIGPGLGTSPCTARMLAQLLENCRKPIVLDADALNIIAATPSMLETIPAGTVITPHPKEFERLFGKSENSMERLRLAIGSAMRLRIVIVLKGAHTQVFAPSGDVYFNSTGNPSMATAGSGDALTGIVAALLAQNYSPLSAALLAVFAHGLAGDLRNVPMGLVASDIIDSLPEAFAMISEKII